eukprot:CAMPEP_0202977544 /NCGR_PEP_ID=MMETSP1396-20130829/84304_1 /ASSEMBLY_ACC=CAM_ASM_000872 /TAXON_ID= /ORGANISM="Pseudokeronopsis sp., Strain Brazil" /LENGTH=353 /DNA_ID=CAMNT_0049716299 /DNA_START=66 /DNA_END=1127 /DNA_ORIENTATION=-
MSGGGSRAAYQAGAIYELIESLPAEDVTWDIVSGVSGGAMNAARMSSYSVGDELSMAEGLKVFWHEMATEDIWKMWEGGLVEGILNQSGVFNSTPAEETVTKMYSEMPPKRGMVVSSVDSKDGVYHSFTELTDFEDLPLVVMASGAAPGVFPPKYLDEMVLMDGGTVWNTNFEVPIKRCLELVDRQDQIVVDIAICQHAELSETYAGDSTIDNILRQHEIKSYYKTLEDLYEFFPPKHLDEMVLMDGGTVWNTNFEVPIKRCLELVDGPEQIVVDIAICQHAELSETYSGDSTIDNILRQHEIKSYYKTLEDLYEFSEANPEVNFRYVFVPSEAIPGGVHMLNFNGDHTDPFF